jgi:hypothetical protein
MSGLIIILFTALFANADSSSPQIAKWKTFRSDSGFELKYPDCWTVQIDDPDNSMPLTEALDILVGESTGCPKPRPRFDPETPNGIGISGWEVFKTKEEATKDLAREEPWIKAEILRKEKLAGKRRKLGSDEAVTYIEILPYNIIRWKTKLYCPHQRALMIGSPTIKNPKPEMLEKIKAGDLNPPEPERTIIESIRCVEPRGKFAIKK